jgi:hypothetical protein
MTSLSDSREIYFGTRQGDFPLVKLVEFGMVGEQRMSGRCFCDRSIGSKTGERLFSLVVDNGLYP